MTRVLFISIPAIPVASNSDGSFRRMGLTEGPATATSFPSGFGPPSIGKPKALKICRQGHYQPRVGGLPEKTTSASVDKPSVPLKPEG